MSSISGFALLLCLATAPEEPYRAYWLVRDDAQARAGYVPLLLCRRPIEQLAGLKQDADRLLPPRRPPDDPAGRKPDGGLPLLNAAALTLQTYKRDSIWNIDRRPFKPVKAVGRVEAGAREVVVDGATYRYEEVPVKEVLRLLEKPEGTMPVHRVHAPLAGAAELAEVLKARLREQLRAPEPGK